MKVTEDCDSCGASITVADTEEVVPREASRRLVFKKRGTNRSVGVCYACAHDFLTEEYEPVNELAKEFVEDQSS